MKIQKGDHMIDKSTVLIIASVILIMLLQAYHFECKIQEIQKQFEEELAKMQLFVAQQIHLNEQVVYDTHAYPNSAFKSYMDRSAITNKTSKQYKIVDAARVDEAGFCKLNGCYLVALGSAFGDVGDVFNIKFSEGVTICAIKSDQKNDSHTYNNEGVQCVDGSIVEFIVEIEKLSSKCRWTGDCSNSGFYGNVVSIEKIGWYNEETGGVYKYAK